MSPRSAGFKSRSTTAFRFKPDLRQTPVPQPFRRRKSNTRVYKTEALFHGDRDDRARVRHRIMQVVRQLQRQLVLPGRELRVENIFAVAEMDPRRRAFDDV